jgi:hypothetical protein
MPMDIDLRALAEQVAISRGREGRCARGLPARVLKAEDLTQPVGPTSHR